MSNLFLNLQNWIFIPNHRRVHQITDRNVDPSNGTVCHRSRRDRRCRSGIVAVFVGSVPHRTRRKSPVFDVCVRTLRPNTFHGIRRKEVVGRTRWIHTDLYHRLRNGLLPSSHPCIAGPTYGQWWTPLIEWTESTISFFYGWYKKIILIQNLSNLISLCQTLS